MARREELEKNIREWRIKKISRYIGGLIFIVLGVLIFIQPFVSGEPMKDAWKFVAGLFIAGSGSLIFADAWNETFGDYISKKEIR